VCKRCREIVGKSPAGRYPLFLSVSTFHLNPLQEHEQDALSYVPDGYGQRRLRSQPAIISRSAGVFSPRNASIRQFTLFVSVSDRWTLYLTIDASLLLVCRRNMDRLPAQQLDVA
jgi:hypothetical protein